jgi:hypothetical protein
MNSLILQAKTRKNASTAPVGSLTSLRAAKLQRKCACGGTPGPSGECEACRKKRLSLQRATRYPEFGTQRGPPAPLITDQMGMPSRKAAQIRAWNFATTPEFALAQASRYQASSLLVQPKLAIGKVNDPLEHEANFIADRVMRMNVPQLSITGRAPKITRKCAVCKEEEQSPESKAAGMAETGACETPDVVHEVLRSHGQPLDPSTRAFFEPRFGHDFSQVRVHADEKAAASAHAVGALAYTVGPNIVFGEGQFAPERIFGKKLLTHELAHVVQQSAADREIGFRSGSSQQSLIQRQDDSNAISQPPQTGAPAAIEVPEGSQSTTSSGQQSAPTGPACVPAPGIPNTDCSAYVKNAWWLPLAYVNNATCACATTPNVPTANCVRKVLQDRLAATPTWLTAIAAAAKVNELNPAASPGLYQSFVQNVLTRRIYDDHVYAYRSCCCLSGPASYLDWIGVTAVPIPCSLVNLAIRYFGSCSGIPGSW